MIIDKGMILIHQMTGVPVKMHERVNPHGTEVMIVGGRAPHRQGATGRVFIDNGEGGFNEFYPTVVNCEWREASPREVLFK